MLIATALPWPGQDSWHPGRTRKEVFTVTPVAWDFLLEGTLLEENHCNIILKISTQS